jgi:hypothetical protein
MAATSLSFPRTGDTNTGWPAAKFASKDFIENASHTRTPVRDRHEGLKGSPNYPRPTEAPGCGASP